MDEFDRKRLANPALLVWMMEQLDLTESLIKRRQESITIYHLAMSMGYFDKKATEALAPHMDSLTTDDLGSHLTGFMRRRVERCVKPLRDLENGRKEWTITNLVAYAHAVGLAVKIDCVPEEGEHSLPARHSKLATRIGSRLFQ